MSNQTISNKPQSKTLMVFANIISYIFHPVFMPTVMAIVLYKLSPSNFAGVSSAAFGKMLLPIILNTLFFPLVAVGLIKGLGFIKSIKMEDPKDRIIPLIAIMIFYFWAYHVFKNIDSPLILRTLLLGSFWGIIGLFMINIFFKISMHTAAAGSVLGIMMVMVFTNPVNMTLPFFVALFIAGIIGTARLILNAHKTGEIWLGYILGVLVQVCAYWYLA